MFKRIALIAAAVAFLSGCETIKTVTVTETVYVVPTVTAGLTKKFKGPGVPFTPEQYLTFTERERRAGLLDMIAEREAIIETCNIRFFAIEDELKAIQKRVNERNKK